MQHLLGRQALNPWNAGRFVPMGSPARLGHLDFFDVPAGAFPVPWGPDDDVDPDTLVKPYPVVPVTIVGGAASMAATVLLLSGPSRFEGVSPEEYQRRQQPMMNGPFLGQVPLRRA